MNINGLVFNTDTEALFNIKKLVKKLFPSIKLSNTNLKIQRYKFSGMCPYLIGNLLDNSGSIWFVYENNNNVYDILLLYSSKKFVDLQEENGELECVFKPLDVCMKIDEEEIMTNFLKRKIVVFPLPLYNNLTFFEDDSLITQYCGELGKILFPDMTIYPHTPYKLFTFISNVGITPDGMKLKCDIRYNSNTKIFIAFQFNDIYLPEYISLNQHYFNCNYIMPKFESFHTRYKLLGVINDQYPPLLRQTNNI